MNLTTAIWVFWWPLALFATISAVRSAVYYGTRRGDRANAHMLVSLVVMSVFIALGLRFA